MVVWLDTVVAYCVTWKAVRIARSYQLSQEHFNCTTKHANSSLGAVQGLCRTLEIVGNLRVDESVEEE